MAKYKFVSTKYMGVRYLPTKRLKEDGRPDQIWYIVYRQGGKVKWERVGATSEGYSAALANQIRTERLAKGRTPPEPAPPSVPTFKEAFETAWSRDFVLKKTGPDYRSSFSLYLTRLWDKPLDKISASDLEAVRASMTAKGLSPATMRHAFMVVGRVFSLMAKWGIYDGVCPTRSVELPKIDNQRMRFLTREEAGRLMEALKERSPYVWMLAMTSLCTGMRKGEAASLMWEHVNLAEGLISVVDTKTSKNRTVYIPGPLAAILSGMEPRPGELVFKRPRNGQNEAFCVSSVFSRVVADLGLNDGVSDTRNLVVFHTLRHTFASWLVSSGESLYTVSTLLGHASTNMTRRYAHLTPEAKKKAVKALEGCLNPFG